MQILRHIHPDKKKEKLVELYERFFVCKSVGLRKVIDASLEGQKEQSPVDPDEDQELLEEKKKIEKELNCQ